MPALYDTVYLVGTPAGEEGTASEGMLTDLNYDLSDRVYWRVTNAVVIGGISGGTATDTDGRFIGVPARGSKNTTQQGLLIPLSAVTELVKGYAVN
jgi:S1-C subfamily serine protease